MNPRRNRCRGSVFLLGGRDSRVLDRAMKFFLFPICLMLCMGCEKKPTPEEIEQKREEIRARATPTPRPPLAKERMKEYKNPLEKKPD